MFEYRVTKYDPSHRDANGAYRRDEWTSVSDIGRFFGGVVLTAEQYQRVEDAYVATAVSFWGEAGQPTLTVRGLENSRGAAQPPSEGSTVNDAHRLAGVLRRVLREELWCRLEDTECFVHVGRDYYMYVGVPEACLESCAFAAASGLFIEPVVSPYRPRNDP